ncbi:hypothetical protein PLICRDRAFT_171865 [Plicaturopsis crispa FD-325 SS-3]|nr:hypothetical protein PLICRDRAFT_171865 [Plicaturopsis crispa FD-325 SS-3]
MNNVLSAFASAGARKRAMTNGSDDMEYEREKRKAMEAEKLRQQKIRDRAPGRRTNGKARAGDIDAILDQIKDEWEFVIDPDFNNVDLALQLLDDSSLGKDMNSFRRTKHMLSKALKGSVDKHYQAFAASLPHHASLLSHLGTTQTQISEARSSIQEAKDALGSKRADLVQLWSRGQTVEEMIRLLDEIEHLKAVPDVLETLMSEKRLLQASVILIRSLKMINKQDMLEIGAVADLRAYLNGQETALREILVDELHSHLYLKSFWCESRWSMYTPNQQTFPKVEFEDEPLTSETNKMRTSSDDIPPSPNSKPGRLSRFLNDLALRPNDPPHDLTESGFHSSSSHQALSSTAITSAPSMTSFNNAMVASAQAPQNGRNPESDSFAYMETLLESLAVLGKLGNALDVVAQRLPGEIFSLVETTLDEVAERAEYGKRGSMLVSTGGSSGRSEGVFVFTGSETTGGASGSSFGPGVSPKGGLLSASSLRLAALESSAKQVDHEVLNDFFWTVYSKLDAVTQGLRLVYEVANRIGSRRDFKDSSGTKPGALFPIAELWMPVQAEVRTLLYDYLTDEEQGAVSGRNPISSINEILREGKFTRDKTKPVFRFADTDIKLTNKTLKQHEDELTRVLKDTMPGLVQGFSENAALATMSSVGTDDRLLGAGQHHRVLIKPDAFHVSVLFQPTLCFLDRVSEILPSGQESARSSSLVLDEFVLKVYLPQLEEKVSLLFRQAVTGPEAFQPDPSSARLSAQPLVKASTQLMALINSLCAMLRRTPFHRENYSRLILGVIIQFYQRCSDRFQDLVSLRSPEDPESEPRLTLAAQWAQRSDMNPCLSELMITPETDIAKRKQLYRQETHFESSFLAQGTVQKSDLVPSTRNLAALCSLYHSVAWFGAELNLLKAAPEDAFSPTTPLRLEPATAVTPYTPYLPMLAPVLPNEQLKLPLSKEMGLRFQALLKTYEQLAELVLHTIRIDIRCRTIHYLDASMRHGNYHIDREAGEPDPHIIDLNVELGKCNAFVSTALPKKEQQFVFAGLGDLMEHLLISNARNLRLVNNYGVKKIMRNMLALQQSIKTITDESEGTEFERSKRYYSLFFGSPADLLDGLRQRQVFTFDEYKTMLNLQCGVNQLEGDAGVAQASDRNYSLYVIELLELENSTEGDR